MLAMCLVAFFLSACGSSSTADGGFKGKGKGKGKNFESGPVPVVVATAAQKNVPIEIQVVGNVEAYSVVSVRPQVSGQLTAANVKDGDYVAKGERMFTLDDRPFLGQLAAAEANLARSTAQRAQAEANLARDASQAKYARDVAQRSARLVEEGIVSRDQAEQQRSNADAQENVLTADRAAIESAKAQIQADQAAANNIRIQLAYTSIAAPIDGRAGTVAQKPGNIVTANTSELMVINQVEPIYVTFAVPEARLADVKRYMEQGALPVVARPQDGSGEAETGRLTFVDNAVDTSTGTIKLKGTFQNSGRKLWPGQFVNVTLRLTTRGGAVVVPNQAVQTGQDGTFVYVVNQDRKVDVRPVVTGPRVDLDLVIEKGVSAGETVVTEGQLRLQPGSAVQLRGGKQADADSGGRGGDRAGDGAKDGGGGFSKDAKDGDFKKEGGFKREGGFGKGNFDKEGFKGKRGPAS